MTAAAPNSADAFSVLASEAELEDRLLIRETSVEVPSGAVAHAVYGGRRALLVPVGPDDGRPTDDRSENVTIRPRALRDPGTGVLLEFLSVECVSRPLFNTFNSLCDEILESLSGGAADPAGVCVEVLERWRELIGAVRRRLMSTSELAGLLAELHLLELLERRVGGARAVGTWAARRAGARHDFRSGHVAVEVKATTSTVRLLVTIHGITQLEEPEGGVLYVYGEQLEPVPEGEDSVPDCLDRLVARGLSRLGLLEILGDRGYRAADEEAYVGARFTRRAARSVRVDSDFPALVPSALVDPRLAEQVESVQYGVDIGAMLGDDATESLLADLERIQ